MKILAVGDLVGTAGLKKFEKEYKEIKEKENIDFCIVNAENVAEGMGITEKAFQTLLKMKVDCITMGNHTWGKKDIFNFIDNPKLIRPANYSKNNPGKGYQIFHCKDKRIAVINLIGRVTMNVLSENPFTVAEDIIEKIGIEKSKEAFNNADLIIFMADRSRVLDEEDFSILSHIGEKTAIVILNKTDLPKAFDETEIEKLLPKAYIIEASVANGEGIEELENVVENLVYGGEVKQSDSMMVTNVRHKNLLEEADSSLADAIEMAKACQPLELLEIDASRAYECLGAIIGEAVEEDIINEVFARFCLGK